jgi:N-methylhydantoinase A/oxoprolinase/acetone carboxylase beta subunit
MHADGFGSDRVRLFPFVDLQYVGQSFALRIPAGERALSPRDGRGGLAEERASFDAAHRKRYGHADSREPVEAVAVRLQAVAASGAPEIREAPPAHSSGPAASVEVVFRDGCREAPIWQRESLGADWRAEGPAIVVQPDATTVIEPGWSATVDGAGTLRLRRA